MRKTKTKRNRKTAQGAPTAEHWREGRHDEDAMDKVHRLELRELMMGSTDVSFYL